MISRIHRYHLIGTIYLYRLYFFLTFTIFLSTHVFFKKQTYISIFIGLFTKHEIIHNNIIVQIYHLQYCNCINFDLYGSSHLTLSLNNYRVNYIPSSQIENKTKKCTITEVSSHYLMYNILEVSLVPGSAAHHISLSCLSPCSLCPIQLYYTMRCSLLLA